MDNFLQKSYTSPQFALAGGMCEMPPENPLEKLLYAFLIAVSAVVFITIMKG